jgi:hypothetical protein
LRVVHRAWLLSLLAACLQKPPHATVNVDTSLPSKTQAVLALPTKTAHGAFVDPALRLKLEFAGYTLAEAGAMRLTTADRIDVNRDSEQIPTDGPQTVAELGMEDIRAVARSLGLQSILIPHLAYGYAGPGESKVTLSITLVDVETMRPQWTVACSETLYEPSETMNRLANCAGNGVLAIFAPANVIGQAR